MLTREREIGRSLQKADPQDRALLDLSLRRKVKDDVVAAVLRLQPEEVVHHRAAALDRLAADLGIYDDAERARLSDVLAELPDDGVAGRRGRTASRRGQRRPAAPAEPPRAEPPRSRPSRPRPPRRQARLAQPPAAAGRRRDRGRRPPRRPSSGWCSSAATRTTTRASRPAAQAPAPPAAKSVAADRARAGLPGAGHREDRGEPGPTAGSCCPCATCRRARRRTRSGSTTT